jgi:protein TonB
MYRMTKRLLCLFSLLLGACAEKPSAPVVPPVPAAVAPQVEAAPLLPGFTLEGYKREVAGRIAAKSPHLFTDPLPDMFKSIVVLDITIGRDGALQRVAVRRSNGFKQLEARALESVRLAAPYAAPGVLVRHGGSVNFLETFLFRADGRFQIRSLVGT